MATNQSNDILGLGTIKTNNHLLTDVNVTNGQNTNINFSYASSSKDQSLIDKEATKLEQSSNLTKEKAMENVLAGIPTTQSTTLKIARTNLDKSDISNSFTTRDEIMSRLGMMDENYNYTDTYTNYINQGGQPLPGYEYAHQELLKQEGYDAIFKQVDEGTLSYDTALMEAYGKDILATMGYDVTSVAYWQNKFLNNDFSTPFSNRYLMDQVKQAAEEYHQSRLASQYSNSTSRDSQLNNLIGKEIDSTLSTDRIKNLFEMDDFKENLDSTQFLRALHGGEISTNMRMTQDSKGTWYYLHTDGKLYVLDGKSGEGHGTLKMNGDEFEGIDLNNSGVVSTLRSTLTGFTGVFTGIGDLGAIAANIVWSAVSCAWGSGFVDGIDTDDFFGFANVYDGWLNDNIPWLVDNGYIDMNSKISSQDVWNFTGSMVGTIAGTMALAGIIGAVGDAGTATTAASKGSGLMGLGEKLTASGHKVAGKSLKGFGTALRWQTGNLGTNTGATAKLFSREMWANGTNLQVWGRRVGAAGVSNLKNFLNDSRKNVLTASMYEEGSSTSEIMYRSLLTNTFNFAIDTFISGGMDDNQFQAYFGRDAGVFSNKAQQEWSQLIGKMVTEGTSDQLRKELDDNVKGVLKKYLLSRAGVIACNSAADLTGNILTGMMSSMSGLDENGQEKEFNWKNWKEAFSPELVARSAVNTLWYSTRSQIKDWNAGLETIGRSHTDLMTRFQLEIDEAKGNPAKQKAWAELRNSYIKDINDEDNKALSYEGKILYAMDQLATGLSKDGKEVPELLDSVISKNVSEASRERLRTMYEYGSAIYAAKMHRIEAISNPAGDTLGIFGKLKHPFQTTAGVAKWLSGVSGSDKAAYSQDIKNANFTIAMKALGNTIIDEKYIDYGKKAEEVINKSINSEMVESKTGYTLSQENKKLFKKISKVDPNAANDQFLYIPNNIEISPDVEANKKALDVSAELGYITKLDIEGETVYKLQPYFDQIDYFNASVVNSIIHKSILALQTKDATLEQKTDVIENLSKTLMDNNVSDVQKAAVISKVLGMLSTKAAKEDANPALTLNEASDIILRLQEKGYLPNLNLKKYKDKISTAEFNRLIIAADIIQKIQKDKGKQIDLSDYAIQKTIKELKDQGSITDEQYNALMKIQQENPESFQNGSIANKQRYIISQIDNRLKDMLPIEDKNILGRLEENSSAEDIALWVKEVYGIDKIEEEFKNSEMYKDIIAFAKEYDDIYKNSKTISVTDSNIVYVDLTKFRGKKTNEFAKRILAIGAPNIKNIGNAKEYKEFESGLYSDMSNMNKYSKINGSLLRFDLNLDKDIEDMKTFMNDFGYEVSGDDAYTIKSQLEDIKGLKNILGNTIVLNIPKIQNIEDIQEALVRGTITVGGKTYNLRDIEFKDLKGNRLQQVDIDRAIFDQVEVRNIDPRISVALKEAPLLNVLPFMESKDGKYNFTEPIASAAIGDEENLRKQSGKQASMTGRDLTYLLKKSSGAKVKYNTPLESYFIIDMLVDKMMKSEYTNIRVSESEVKWLRENKLVDDSLVTSKKNPENIWKLSGDNHHASLQLKEGVTKDKIMTYVTSENFNLYKLFPLQIQEVQDPSKHGIITTYATHTTEGLEESLPGTTRETGFSLFDTKLPWDDENNSRMLKFIKQLKDNKGTELNPIKGSGFTAHTEEVASKAYFETFDDWYKHAETSKDPYDILTKLYVDEFNNMVHNSDSDEYDNHTLLLANKEGRRLILDEIRGTDIKPEATAELVNKLKQVFEPINDGTRTTYSTNGSKTTAISSHYTGSTADTDSLYVSPDSVALAMGGYNNIEVKSDIDWIDIDTVQKAIDLAYDIQTNENNSYRTSLYDNNIAIDYIENDATKLLKNVVGTDGYIQIQDIDEIANILAENYRQVMDGTEQNFKVKETLVPVLKELYGKSYNEAVDEIFKQAKKHQSLANKQFETVQKHIVNKDISAESNSYTTLDYMPTKDGKPTEIGRNFNTLERYVKNSILNSEDNPSDSFNKLMTNSDELLDNDLYDALQKKISDDRNLYTSAPYATDIDKYSYAHNARGIMMTTINTFKELKAVFKDAKDEDLMHTASTLVNLHQGVEYAGETANFIIVKNGSLKDGNIDLMDKYASANYKDLLFNLHKAKQELKGCTLLKVSSQGIDNVAGLKMSYETLDSDEKFNTLVTNLYKNFIIENSYYLTKDGVDLETLQQQIFGGSTNIKNIQELLNRIPAERMSSIQRNKKLYDVYRDRAEVANISKGEFYSMMKGVGVVDMNTLARDAIANTIDFDENYKSNKNGMAPLINLQFGLGNIDNMTPERRMLINYIKEDISSLYNDSKELTPQQQAKQIILKNIIDREDAPSLDYLTRHRSLLEMREETLSDNMKDGFAINSDNGTISRMDTKTILDLVKSINTNDPTIETKYNTVISFDTETSLRYNASDYDKGIFNIGINVKTKTENGWEVKRYDIFVNYETDNMTEAQRTKFRQNWVKENIDISGKAKDFDNSFYFRNTGYQDTVSKYLDIYNNLDDNTLYLKPSEIKEFFSKYASEGTLLLGYNTSQADIPWMKTGKMFDNDLLSKMTHVDVKVLGDTSQAIETKTSGKKDIRAEEFGLKNEAAHSGIYDADVTTDLFLKVAESTFNISSIRNFLYRDIMKDPELTKLGISEEQLVSILGEIDNDVRRSQEKFPEIKDYFDYDKKITTDTITAATDIFEFIINKRMADMTWAIKDQQVADNYFSAKALKSLSDNSQEIVSKMWKFAKDNGVSKENLLNSIRIEMKYTGTDMNSLLETLGDEVRVLRILDRVGLDSSQFDKNADGEKLFNGNPYDDKELDQEKFNDYNTIASRKDFLDTFHQIAKGIKFSNDSDLKDFMNDLGTFYEFREGLDPKEFLSDDVKLIDTKTSKLYKEYLYKNYGDVDAVIAQSKQGIYDLIDALPVGKEVHDTISGKTVITDSSMIVLSRAQFNNLMGNTKFEGDELYSQLLIHPADANNKILPRRIIVDDTLPGYYMQVPETVIEVLGSRDFDGDHLILLKPNDYSQEVLRIYTNEMYKIHNTQEAVLSYLRQGTEYDDFKSKNLILNQIGKNKEVLDLCKAADKLLEQHSKGEVSDKVYNKQMDTLTKDFKDTVTKNFGGDNVQKALDDLWLVEKVLYEDTGDTTPIRYINNLSVYGSDNLREVTLNGKTYNVPVSFSGQERLRAEDSQLVNKYLYNFIDQTTGMSEKYAINKLKNTTITNPWTDLLASGIYASNTVYKYFKNIDGTPNENGKPNDYVVGLCDRIYQEISDTYSNSGYYSEIDKIVKPALNDITKYLTHGENTRAFNSYDDMLRKVEEVQRKSLDSSELINALTSDKMKAQYEDMYKRIEIIKKNIELYNSLAQRSRYLPDDTNKSDVVNYNLNNLINDLVQKNDNSYNNDVFKDATPLNGFVITRFGDSETPIGIGEDTVLYNNNKEIPTERRLCGYTKIVYKLSDKDKLNDIKQNVFLNAHTKLTKGKNPIELNQRSLVVDANKHSVTVIQVDWLDNGFKIATDVGGKGVVNGTYSTDPSIQILVNKAVQNKLSVGSTRPIDNYEEIPITLTDSNGNKITAYGYKTEVKTTVTEDTHFWKKSNDRNIDALHVVMDSNTLNGILDMGAKFEDGKLTTNPEAYAELRESVYKPYKDVQTKNALGTYNKAKLYYILNRISDAELQKAFNTDTDPSKLRYNLTHNMYLATEKYTSIAYTLGKIFEHKIDDDFGRRLFSDEALALLGDYKRSRATATNPFGAISKTDIPAQTNMKEDGTTGLTTYNGRVIHLDTDVINNNKGITNHEDFYLSPFDLMNLLSNGTSKLNSYNVKRLIKEGYLPYSEFIPDTATMENGFRNYSGSFTTKDSQIEKFIPQSQSRKTGLTTTKADVIGYKPTKVDLEIPNNNEIINTRSNDFSNEIINLINNGETNLPNNYAKTAMMIYQLQNLNPNSTLDQKRLDLSNSKKVYGITDSHYSVQYNEDGQPNIVLSKNIPLEGSIKELQKAVSNSVYNYATLNALRNVNVNEETLDAKTLDNTVDKSSYKKSKQNFDKELDNIYSSIKESIVNDTTGEVKTDFKPEDYNTGSKVAPARILSGGEESMLEKSVWGRQGLKEDTELGAELTVALKNQSAGAAFIEQEPMRILQEFKQIAMSRMSDEEIKEFAVCQSLFQCRDSSIIKEALNVHGYNSIDEVASKLENFRQLYPEVDTAFKKHLESLKNLNEIVAKETGEPLGNCLMAEIAPYKSTNKEYNKAKAASAIKNALGLQLYNPAYEKNKQASTLEFDLWNSSESIIKELSKMHSAKVIKDTLVHGDMLKNDTLLNGVSDLLDQAVANADDKAFVKQTPEQKMIQNQTFDVINDLTGIQIRTGMDNVTLKQYKQAYDKINTELMALKDKFVETTGLTDVITYTDFDKLSQDTSQRLEVRNSAKAIANFYYAKMLVGQSMIQSNTDFANSVGAYLQSLKSEGYSFVNAYGQKYVKGGVVNPLSSSSMANLVENMQISYNSYNETMWNQFMLEKIISGEIYLCRNDIADHLESHVYTTKIPNNTMKTLKTISKWSSALQMALPSKILNRVISFTGFDYSMGVMYDPATIKFMGPARKELLAAFQSKGTQMSDELTEYMMREGQPIGLTGKDPITFTEDISGPDKVMRVLNTLTDPLEFQNHLGRYAIYLAAKESFDKQSRGEAQANYGPAYFAKDAIDSMDNNADKAMMVMDYMLGSPGGFPELSKKTNGLMLYATFPMNFARTMGAYGMSLGKLFKEGFTPDNANQWMKTAVVPSMGLAGVTGLSMLITSFICDLFGIEEDEKEKMVTDLSTIDPVGTLISGSPQKSGSSMNPVENINSMFIDPFTNEYNETFLEKVFGLVNTNVTSHLNPAIKVPLEVATGYDIYGSSLMNTKYQYNNIENGLRKVLGFFIGSNTSNAIVNQYKMDKYEEDSNFLSTLMKGTTRGIAASLGNQKTYKKDITNYYNRLTDIRNFKYKKSNGTYDEDVEDYTYSKSMSRIRATKSKYGSFENEDYQRVNNMLKKMIKNKEEAASIYSYIISEYNSGTSEATLKSALNNNSIIRKLDSIDKHEYFNTLSSSEYSDLLRAIQYENDFYPILQELFPNGSSTSLSSRKKYYKSSWSSGSSSTPYTRYYKPTFVNYYPNSGYNKKTTINRSKSNIDKVDVQVSPEMAVWKNDYNKVQDLTTYNKNKNKRKNLLDKDTFYINNPYYNNLSDYEKKKKAGK